MNSRGQSALEYLMTYGWALIVIAIVVGLLVYILSSTTTGGAECSANTTQFNLQQYSVQTGAGNAKFVIQNATGRKVSGIVATSGNDFNGDVNTLAGSFKKGTTFTIAVAGPTSSGTFTNGTVNVQYDTEKLKDTNFLITCSGSV